VATDGAPAGMSPDQTSETPARQPAATEAAPVTPDDVAAASAPATADAPPAGADTLSPKLQNVNSAVIIRRGDTLWRISRRVYGRGVRYSTIYLANQDQIQNPHLILPGQVFKVPDNTKEGEPADLTQMGDQAVEPPATP
jgi:nucleoid-associated protein YgaU